MTINQAVNEIIQSESILSNVEKFTDHLQLQKPLFELLKTNTDLSRVLVSEEDPSAETKLPIGAILSSLNGMGQLAFTMMVLVRATGWTPGALTVLKAGGFDAETTFKDAEKLSLNVCPVQTSSLLETLSWLVLEFLTFPCLKIAYADSEFSATERRIIIKLFTEEWGYNPEFVDKFISQVESRLGYFTYKRFTDNLKEISRLFPEINYEEMRDDLKSIIRKVIMADDKIHPNEQQQLDEFFDCLALDEEQQDKPSLINNLWDHIFKSDDDDHNKSIVDILKKVPLFQHLTKRELKIISKLVYRRVYHSGEYIFQMHQPGAAMFIVKRGSVNILLPGPEQTETLLATLGAGTFFGELALLDNSPRSATAKSAETTETITFFRSEFNRLLNMYPSVGIKVMKQLALIIGQRLKATNEQISVR